MCFVSWSVALLFVDVRAIGPQGSFVGFAGINEFFRQIIGVNFTLYTITDWLGLVPICVAAGFGLLGLIQIIKRKSISKVDKNILVLGGFYVVVMMIYILFEFVVINRRPVLIEGFLEASYPSSTTMLVMTVMPSAIIQFHLRIKNKALRGFINTLIVLFIAFMVLGRFVSGVHWFSDIIGGVLLSSGLVMMYYCLCD